MKEAFESLDTEKCGLISSKDVSDPERPQFFSVNFAKIFVPT